MKFINAFALVLTVLLYLVRQRCVFAGICPVKRHTMESTACSHGDSSFTAALQATQRVSAARATNNAHSCCRPKYKRDPDIQIDNENIGVSPIE